MSKSQQLEETLVRAKEKEKKYDWLEAAEVYEQALGNVNKGDFLRKGEIGEKIGYCFHRAAFQAETKGKFKERMRRAVGQYEKAHDFYGKLTDEKKTAWMFRCNAVAKYFGYWLTPDPSEKRALLDECLELEGKALTLFSESGNMMEYGRTYNELSLVSYLRGVLEWDRQTLKGITEKGLRWGEKAVAGLLSLAGPQYEAAMAYFGLAACLTLHLVYFVAEPEEKYENQLKIAKYLGEAIDVSKKVGDAYVLGLSHGLLSFTTRGEESAKHLEKTVESGKQTRDNFLIAWGLDFLTTVTHVRAVATEDPEKRRKLAEEAMKFYDKAHHHYSIISFLNPTTSDATANYAYYYWRLAMWETDPERRRGFLEKSEKAGLEALKVAEDSEMPNVVLSALNLISSILADRASMEPESEEKRNLLKNALKHQEKAIEIHRQLPFDYWVLGGALNHLADIKAELAAVEPDLDSRRRLLEEAVSTKEKCLELSNKGMSFWEKIGSIMLFVALQRFQDTYATLLTRLYNLTNNPDNLKKAIESQRKAIESASKLDMVSHIAESYWKIARVQDVLRQHSEAAESFEQASKSYMEAAEKIPPLRDFYQDHASYMEAWSEIEKAKNHHAERQYGQAKTYYEKAADLHKSTVRWNYLHLNYSACSRLEEAEDLSRGEQTREAKTLFQQAAQQFLEAEKTIKAKLERIETRDEKEMAAELVKASHMRSEYCLGRIDLEEAKILDRQGNHDASSKKYAVAAEKFQRTTEAVTDELGKQELKPILVLCRAWHIMTRAEAEASPELYLEASNLFEEAKKHSSSEKEKMLALGHSRFCKALEAGTRFEDTSDPKSYSEAIRHLESSANYYVKAGFKTASEYAKATHRLFDAYMYTHKADTETDPEKKTQYYQMAERLLQASAELYMKAKHPAKGGDVQRLLESVKEERELAMSLAEVLHAPTIASTTASFSTPYPIYEQAVGLERFEHAHVQANLFVQFSEAKVGDNIALEMELVNAGKGQATLVKVEDIIPAGFNIIERPEMYRVEDSYLNLKGKTLGPLKTEEVKVVVKPQSKGIFIMRPRILYLDEVGKYKSHELEPVTITVRELGISGWIKGERSPSGAF